jgi:hypothetical protein
VFEDESKNDVTTGFISTSGYKNIYKNRKVNQVKPKGFFRALFQE